jgi:regulator of RNase E activity RraA
MPTERPTRYLSAEAEEALTRVSTATLTSQLLKRGFRNTFLTGVEPLRPDLRMVGYAFTLRFVPMREDLDHSGPVDNLTSAQRIAIESVGPGDVLVMDARGDVHSGTIGDILTTRMKVLGAVGVVTDGALRDRKGMQQTDLPSYAAATHGASSPTRHHPADINQPIGCAGVLVMPGDVVVGDADGVVVIPAAVAEEVAHAALEQEEMEAFVLKKIEAGASILGVYPPDEKTRAEYEASRKR